MITVTVDLTDRAGDTSREADRDELRRGYGVRWRHRGASFCWFVHLAVPPCGLAFLGPYLPHRRRDPASAFVGHLTHSLSVADPIGVCLVVVGTGVLAYLQVHRPDGSTRPAWRPVPTAEPRSERQP